jgi:Zn-finger nucleic acid-binding protein
MTLYDSGGYFHCEYCGSFHFPEELSDGLKLLGPADGAANCPVCQIALHHVAVDGVEALHCTQCRGLLIPQEAFKIVVEGRRARAQDPPAPPRPLNRALLERRVRCPRCSKAMHTHPYYGPGNIVVDTCSRCRFIWLDHGELDTVTNAPGRDRGKPPQNKGSVIEVSARKKPKTRG